MIASIASVRDLPLYTRNVDDFEGLGSALTVVGL
ncbi:putative nucleic acid-binding protein [Streptomyces sp. HB372]|nr:putative nucleic acid-binding protein [Streptomyces sp. HB372]